MKDHLDGEIKVSDKPLRQSRRGRVATTAAASDLQKVTESWSRGATAPRNTVLVSEENVQNYRNERRLSPDIDFSESDLTKRAEFHALADEALKRLSISEFRAAIESALAAKERKDPCETADRVKEEVRVFKNLPEGLTRRLSKEPVPEEMLTPENVATAYRIRNAKKRKKAAAELLDPEDVYLTGRIIRAHEKRLTIG
ncbi:MAG: hypothetical protein J0H57_01815 [Rhodospirillales bacterium]|nr:hypothetical protein [Rhodospirillales bacterium]